jgi:hypothetical protein
MNARLYLQARALNRIKNHLLAGGTDTDFMLRLAGSTLRQTEAGPGDRRIMSCVATPADSKRCTAT